MLFSLLSVALSLAWSVTSFRLQSAAPSKQSAKINGAVDTCDCGWVGMTLAFLKVNMLGTLADYCDMYGEVALPALMDNNPIQAMADCFWKVKPCPPTPYVNMNDPLNKHETSSNWCNYAGKRLWADFNLDLETGHSVATAVRAGIGVEENCKEGDLLEGGDMAQRLKTGMKKLEVLKKFRALSAGKDVEAQTYVDSVKSACGEAADIEVNQSTKSAARASWGLKAFAHVLVLLGLARLV
eukprot:TRINITY_DN17789_c0_g1_i1.p1 TRINITY_DN17789_c0_g1~~TRINITY_DN17789_c0_g1_i1.p1  ORF type:complete len:240 (+),score=28.56 TRINITY_DN17789_c0_g1_i1:40-759(+)